MMIGNGLQQIEIPSSCQGNSTFRAQRMTPSPSVATVRQGSLLWLLPLVIQMKLEALAEKYN